MCWTLEQATKAHGRLGALGMAHLLILLVCSTLPLLAVGAQDAHEQQSCLFPLNFNFFLSIRKGRKETGRLKTYKMRSEKEKA